MKGKQKEIEKRHFKMNEMRQRQRERTRKKKKT